MDYCRLDGARNVEWVELEDFHLRSAMNQPKSVLWSIWFNNVKIYHHQSIQFLLQKVRILKTVKLSIVYTFIDCDFFQLILVSSKRSGLLIFLKWLAFVPSDFTRRAFDAELWHEIEIGDRFFPEIESHGCRWWSNSGNILSTHGIQDINHIRFVCEHFQNVHNYTMLPKRLWIEIKIEIQWSA